MFNNNNFKIILMNKDTKITKFIIILIIIMIWWLKKIEFFIKNIIYIYT